MTRLTDVDRALGLVQMAHGSQRYGGKQDEGEPYLCHLIRVAAQFTDPQLRVIGLLHDSVEDTDVSLDEIRQKFDDTVALAVDHLTHQPHQTYQEYIRRVAQNPLARQIKCADLRDNLFHLDHVYPVYGSRRSRYQWALAFLEALAP